MTEIGDDNKTRTEFILDYRQLISSLENQKHNANVPAINYHKLLLEQENFFNSGEEIINDVCSEPNNVKWKLSEVNRFFTALQRCGKHNPVEISRRVKTKTPLQVMMYIERLENELQYAKEIGRIKKEPLDYEDIPAAREMSEKWTKFEDKSAKILIRKFEENETNRKNSATNEFNQLKLQQDREKIELFELENFAKLIGKLDMKAKDEELSSHVLCSFYDVLRGWLTIIIHDLIILNQHHKRLCPQENIKHPITVQEIYGVLRFRDYKIKSDLQQHMPANWNVVDQANENYLQFGKVLLRNLDDNDQCNDSACSDDYIEAEDNNENEEDEEMKDVQNLDSSNYEDFDAEEYVNQKEQFEQVYKLESKESTIDKLYEKALVKLLCEHNRFAKLQEEINKLESIFYHATMWNDYINHIKLDKVLQKDKDNTYDFFTSCRFKSKIYSSPEMETSTERYRLY